MSRGHQLVVRIDERQLEGLKTLSTQQERSVAFLVRALIDGAIAKVAPKPKQEHVHAGVKKNALKLDVCECGAVLGKDFQWRMP
jgi:hypothetical protein